jgi:hypothetical protein
MIGSYPDTAIEVVRVIMNGSVKLLLKRDAFYELFSFDGSAEG